MYNIMSPALRTLARVEYRGQQHIPKNGPIIVATNHMSRMDTLYLFITPERKDITALVADKYAQNPLFKYILTVGGVVWLDRDKADFSAFKKAVDAIRTGVAMGIAPEGTRSQNGQLQEGKPGVVLLASRTNVPIVPVGIAGTEEYFKRLFSFRRPRVTLTFGPAFHLPPLDRSRRDEQMKELTDEIMCRIAALLPEKYWGFYKDYPRVQQLIQEQSNA